MTSLGRRPTSWYDEPITDWYDYQDESGVVLFSVARTPSKEFPVYHPEGTKWASGYGALRVLYRLPELLAADPSEPVVLTEGEKDCDRARDEGFIATTRPGGAKAANLCDLKPLAGRKVAIFPDNDEPGAKYGATLKGLLTGKAAVVRVIELWL